ncbi:hypothetical protein GWI33_020866 [Rhynchophorus ferrugineus]|uniref:Uncharacterized protein n=1 Tax=Rhynchophorus ferrugineus TaxID=354439 RepID=A0A834HTQ0_RHYFE|nr:hypothetical protein GWI33_020866 [Rhynchophorus ferrugineus]
MRQESRPILRNVSTQEDRRRCSVSNGSSTNKGRSARKSPEIVGRRFFGEKEEPTPPMGLYRVDSLRRHPNEKR